jgi:hypothetical protein
MEFFTELEPLLRTFWYITIPASVIFIIQTIMTFVGADASDGTSADFDGDFDGTDAPFQLFSFRNLINFLLGFGWSGISFYSFIKSPILLIIVSLLIGCAFVYMFFIVIKQLMKLSENDTFKLTNTLNKNAEVYLTIPTNRTGKGKILVSVNGSVHELEAITDGEKINSGAIVRVAKIENENTIVVEII